MELRLIFGALAIVLPTSVAAQPPAARGGAPVFTAAQADIIIDEESGLLGRPWDVTIDSRGVLYLIDYTMPAIMVVEPQSRKVETVGRRGAGPGEFAQPWALAVHDDTLWVADGRALRIQALPPAGSTSPPGRSAASGLFRRWRLGAAGLSSLAPVAAREFWRSAMHPGQGGR